MHRRLDFLLGIPLVWLFSLLARAKRPAPPLRRVLVIKLAAVGDTVLLAPVLKALKKALPEAQIDWLVSDVNAAYAALIPHVDRRLVWRRASLGSFFSLMRELRAARYDAVVDLEQWSRGTALLAYFSGAAVRVGFDTPGQHRARLYTAVVPKTYRQHEIDDFYDAISVLRPLSKDRTLEAPPTEAGKEELSQVLRDMPRPDKGPWVLLQPGCGADGTPREWPLSDYAVLGNWLINNYGAVLFLSGGPDERWKTAQLRQLLNGQAYDMGGRLSWEGTAALVGKMALVVSGNTGIMHIAAAFAKPQVALHGPTDPAIWGPLNPNARVIQSPCPDCPSLKLGFEYHRRDQNCMAQIGVADVKSAVAAVFDNPKGI